MIYECRKNALKKQSVYAGLLIVLVLAMSNYLGIFTSEYWWGYSIGIILALVVTYLTSNTKVSVKIEGERVIVYHDGMVYGNVSKDSITEVSVGGADNLSRITVVTDDGLKIYIPAMCFSETEIESLVKALRST
jgi:hypothetical protein